jgi:Protein of unknown function (DUF2628)
MKIYTVHEPSDAPADRIDRAEKLKFVGDGFDWQTLALPPVALLGYKLYGAFAAYVAILAAVIGGLYAIGANPGWMSLAYMAINVLVAFEIGELRRSALDRKGWSMLATVSGKSQAECERRFYDDWLSRQPVISNLRTASANAPSAGDLPGVASPPQAAKAGFRMPWVAKT